MTHTQIPLAGVIGHPIAHSKSPKLHGYWLRHYGISGHYVPLNVPSQDLKSVLRSMPNMGFVGANVTIPHKEAVLALADNVSETARRIGAANTLTFLPDGRLHADNTDAFGFMANVQQNAPDWRADVGPAMVIGAGGAARAVIVALLDAGAPEVIVTNRTAHRAADLAREFGPRIRPLLWETAESAMKNAAFLVNTSALGMAGQAEFSLSLQHLRAETLVTDIVYTPLQTDFLIRAADRGCRCVDGLGMLLHQAVPGFAQWFGVMPQVDAATRAAVLAP